jgi:hypothetical protein
LAKIKACIPVLSLKYLWGKSERPSLVVQIGAIFRSLVMECFELFLKGASEKSKQAQPNGEYKPFRIFNLEVVTFWHKTSLPQRF